MSNFSPTPPGFRLLLQRMLPILLAVSLGVAALLAVFLSVAHWFERRNDFDEGLLQILALILVIAPVSCWLCLRDSRIREFLPGSGRKFLLLAGTSLVLYEILFWGMILIEG